MKTIFITCFHPFIFRNILRTEAFTAICRARDTKVVMVVSAQKKAYFEDALKPLPVTVEGFAGPAPGAGFGRLFVWLSRNIQHTDTVRFLHRRKLNRERIIFRYYFFLLPLRVLGYSRFAVSFLRFLDAALSFSGEAPDIFEKYKPDLVFSTDAHNENDVIFLQEAKRRGISTVAMARSWDKLSWFQLRAVPDRLLVWSDLRKKEAAELNFVPEERIVVTGVPHYAKYMREKRTDRVRFLTSLGLDPAKKTIFFVLLGDQWVEHNTANCAVLEILAALPHNVIVRFPIVDRVSFVDDFRFPPNMAVNRPGVTVNNAKLSFTEITDADDRFLADALFHGDVVVCGELSIALDAALFSKPTIIVNFYPEQRDQWHDKVIYHSTHAQYVLSSGGVRMASSKEEFLEELDSYLKNPRRDEAERKKMLKEQCGPQDGKAEERLADAVLHMLR